MPDPTTLNLTHPICEAITIVLTPATNNSARLARRRLTTALRQKLGRSATGWRVQRVAGSDQLAYDLIPPSESSLTIKQAWDLTYALRTLPNVVDAEPSFIVIQDAAPEAPSAETALSTPGVAAIPRALPLCSDDQAPTVDPDDVNWGARLIDAPCAWQLAPPAALPGFTAGQRKGKGIRVGHPDSGYLLHDELFDDESGLSKRVLTQLERDFVKPDSVAQDRLGQHGLRTACVIMSSDESAQLMGIAPAAEIVPLRVTKPHIFDIPAPILFGSGARALRDAIRYAVNEAGCHVISISLGWFDNRSLHTAVIEAAAKNVIICAAAGNYTGIVIWPAAYPEVIAVAGCNAERRRWSPSARGKNVGVSAPAENVWVASFRENGDPIPAQSSGTSFAVAHVAGVAALWLAFHGRDQLLALYHPHFTLSAVFRFVLGQSSDPFAEFVGNNFGVGIVNARRVLKTPLPTLAQLQMALPAFSRAAALPSLPSPLDPIAAAFPDVPIEYLRTRLAAMMHVHESELDTKLAGVSEEVLFHLITDPTLRTILSGEPPAAGMELAVSRGAAALPSVAALPSDALSDRLRSRVA